MHHPDNIQAWISLELASNEFPSCCNLGPSGQTSNVKWTSETKLCSTQDVCNLSLPQDVWPKKPTWMVQSFKVVYLLGWMNTVTISGNPWVKPHPRDAVLRHLVNQVAPVALEGPDGMRFSGGAWYSLVQPGIAWYSATRIGEFMGFQWDFTGFSIVFNGMYEIQWDWRRVPPTPWGWNHGQFMFSRGHEAEDRESSWECQCGPCHSCPFMRAVVKVAKACFFLCQGPKTISSLSQSETKSWDSDASGRASWKGLQVWDGRPLPGQNSKHEVQKHCFMCG